MDQLKVYLALAKKHHFWVITGVISLIGLGVWWLTTSDLKQRHADNTNEARSKYQQMSQIINQPSLDVTDGRALPNQKTLDGMRANIGRLQQEVYQAWVQKYERQIDLLKWPQALDEDFIREVRPLWPIEEKLSPERRDEILSIGLRERYRDYIKEELPKLAGKIGSRWQTRDEEAVAPVRAADGTEAARSPDPDLMVTWSSNNQRNIQTKHFDWSDKSDLDPPTTLEILYAQEDLWVLQSLMDVIAKTNSEATAAHDAVIRHIHFINIGKNALGRIGQISKVEAESADEEAAAEYGGGQIGGAQQEAEQARAVAVASNDPAEGRYVDNEYKPLPAERLRSALKSNAAEDAYLAVAKRMPVQMRFTMDQRKLNDLQVNFGNADLLVEIRQVRVQGKSPAEAEASRASEDQAGSKQDDFAWDVDVELYGIIHVYNPANPVRIGLPEDAIPTLEAPADTPGAEPTPPAPNNATPPEPADVTATTPAE